MNSSSSQSDLVRQHSPSQFNRRIDEEFFARLRLYLSADHDAITRRIDELEREWDIERVLEANASSLILAGTLLGTTVCRKWLALPAVVSGFLLHHALRGWCPPIPLLRRLGVRTRMEIERERYALKLLRGDFRGINPDESPDADRVIQAVSV